MPFQGYRPFGNIGYNLAVHKIYTAVNQAGGVSAFLIEIHDIPIIVYFNAAIPAPIIDRSKTHGGRARFAGMIHNEIGKIYIKKGISVHNDKTRIIINGDRLLQCPSRSQGLVFLGIAYPNAELATLSKIGFNYVLFISD